MSTAWDANKMDAGKGESGFYPKCEGGGTHKLDSSGGLLLGEFLEQSHELGSTVDAEFPVNGL